MTHVEFLALAGIVVIAPHLSERVAWMLYLAAMVLAFIVQL